MKARDLARPYPVLAGDAPAEEAGRLLAEEHIDVLLVQGADGQPVGALHDIGLLTAVLPAYLVEDRALARMLGDGDAHDLWERLRGRTVGELLDGAGRPLPVVAADATVVQVAAQMCATGSALLAVMDGPELLGAVTSSAVITALLGPA